MNRDVNKDKLAAAKLGLLGVYNQDWAMTRYVDRFLANFHPSEVVVFAEAVSKEQLIRPDDSRVLRLWHRTSFDYSALGRAIVEQGVTTLHVNCCFPFFDRPEFSKFVSQQRANGVCIAAHIHDLNALDSVAQFLSEDCDLIVVDSPSSKLVTAAAGIPPTKIEVIESAVDNLAEASPKESRQKLSLGENDLITVCFDFGLPEAKIEDVIAAVYQLQATEREAHLYVLQIDGGTGFEVGYGAALKRKVESLHLDHFVHFIQDKAGSSSLDCYISAADVVVLSSSRPQNEAREVLGLALSCGTPIVAATKLAFDGLDGTVFPVSKRYPLALAIETVAFNEPLRQELRENSKLWALAHNASASSQQYQQLYQGYGGGQFQNIGAPAERNSSLEISRTKLPESSAQKSPAYIRKTLRILMQNRANALTHAGGDTIVMQQLARGFSARGHRVDIDLEQKKNPKDYDLVHLYNFAMREATEQMARNVHACGVPYVVTTMYEDWPLFYNQMASLYYLLNAYVDAGQPREKWTELLRSVQGVDLSPIWDNSWTANHCQALIATGKYEADILRRDYPKTKRVEVYHCGRDYTSIGDDGQRFRTETGLEDFVLCVGRLEWRKNQLMLLKALEESDLTVVFATGGFTYQKEYEAACRKFKRKGKTVFLGRLEPELLASAFNASRIHVLPSWFELPGIVSLEAAQYGKNVVVTDYGTSRDYFGDLAYYCSPGDDQSIYNAVLAAYHSPAKNELVDCVAKFTWEAAVERNLEIYNKVLDQDCLAPPQIESQVATPVDSPRSEIKTSYGYDGGIDSARIQAERASHSVAKIPEVVGAAPNPQSNSVEATNLCLEGDRLMAKNEPELAREKYERALGVHSNFARAYRSIGVVELSNGNASGAEGNFKKALRYDPRDIKALLGLGAIRWESGDKNEAFELYLRAAENDPNCASAILYLVNAAYELGKLDDLERALRRFLQENRNNLSIQYCLAGCYFRQQKYARAKGVVEHILCLDSNHEEALELKARIEQVVLEDKADADPLVGSFKPTNVLNGANGSFSANSGNNTSLSERLSQLEEQKRAKSYQEVIVGAEQIINDQRASQSEKALATILKAESMGCSGEAIEADSLFAKVISDSTYGFRACSGRAAIAASQENWGEAVRFFERALLANSKYDPAIAGLGICAVGNNEPERAWGYFMQALSINSENTQAIHGVINLGYRLGRLGEVEKVISNYLEMRPVDFGFVYSLAGCLYAQGRLEDARSQCEKILLFEPEHKLAKELQERLDMDEQKLASAR